MSSTIKHILSSLPAELDGLLGLALDIRYTWEHSADSIWEQLNPLLWEQTRNPWLVLQTASEQNVINLANNREAVQLITQILQKENEEMRKPGWYEQTYPQSQLKTVAYFSMEFGLSESLPIYSGGLGLLAGDHLKAAQDLRTPLVGVGILYQNGYFRQSLDNDGRQIALYPNSNLYELPVTPVRDDTGEWLRLDLHFAGQNIKVRVWQATVGRVTLYLLDTNDPVNDPVVRCITTELYGGGEEQRLQQEILLGIGGWRVLHALNIHPEVCHLNEGHAAFAILDRALSYMHEHEVDFHAALTITRAGNLFTTHTPVDAGFDRFPTEMMHRYFHTYVEKLGISFEEFSGLGKVSPNDPNEPFNMAYLAIRGSNAVNAVSKLHGEVSRGIFAPLFPNWPVEEVPVGHVTNGVHVPTWDSAKSDKLWTDICGKQRWKGDYDCLEHKFNETEDSDLWILRMQNRKALVDYIRHEKVRQLSIKGYSDEEALDRAHVLFNPNILTLGFARRFAAYKRPNLLLHDPERLIRILTNPERPMQIVIAGKAHPADTQGQDMIQQWQHFIQRPEVADHVNFIQDYNMHVAAQLVGGVDIWLNNPRRPWEASGTSGMKVLVNGGLNLSELDGWWAEAYTPEVGWAIGDGQQHGTDESWDAYEATQIYQLLENEILPQFYERDAEGIPKQWVNRMRASMTRLTPFYSTNRMVQQYIENYYVPLAAQYLQRSGSNKRTGTELKNWLHQIDQCWSTISFGSMDISFNDDQVTFYIPVYFGEIDAETIKVQLYAMPLNEGETAHIIDMQADHELTGSCNAFMYTTTIDHIRDGNDYTVRVIPNHPQVSVPAECSKIMWQK